MAAGALEVFNSGSSAVLVNAAHPAKPPAAFMLIQSDILPASRVPFLAEDGAVAGLLSGAKTDEALIRRFIAGDESAFVEIVQRHRAKVLAISLGLLRNRADAEEVTQDTFIRVHGALVKFRGGCSLATWVYRIAVNLSRNRYWFHFRRRRHDSFSMDQALNPDNAATPADLIADHGADPARAATVAEFSALVERCMWQLARCHREILILRTSENCSYDEIAARLGLNTGTVKSRIARARVNLRGLLVQACPEFSRDASLPHWFLPAHSAHTRPPVLAA